MRSGVREGELLGWLQPRDGRLARLEKNPAKCELLPRLGERKKETNRLFFPELANCLIVSGTCRFSSAVEQRFCKPKVGSSILSTGTMKLMTYQIR